MKYFKNKSFQRDLKDNDISDEEVKAVLDDIFDGRATPIGCKLYKIRGAKEGKGKSAVRDAIEAKHRPPVMKIALQGYRLRREILLLHVVARAPGRGPLWREIERGLQPHVRPRWVGDAAAAGSARVWRRVSGDALPRLQQAKS